MDNPSDPYRFPWPVVAEVNFGLLLTKLEQQQLLYANRIGLQGEFTHRNIGKYTHTTPARPGDDVHIQHGKARPFILAGNNWVIIADNCGY